MTSGARVPENNNAKLPDHSDPGAHTEDQSSVISEEEAAQLADLMPDENGEAEGRPIPTGV